MLVFSAIVVALAFGYSLAVARFTGAFRKLVAGWSPSGAIHLKVTVVVPARNEARNIRACLKSLLDNEYPDQSAEFVVVDDCSEDDTARIVSTIASETKRVKLVQIQNQGSGGKRRAIEAAIAKSDGDLILVTDADSEVPPTWIRTMASAFSVDTKFVAGPVAYKDTGSLLNRLLQLELLGLVAIGAGAIGLGRPNMCNGANIAFRRSAFAEVGGYAGTDQVTSGDDELLMQKMARAHPASVAFCPDPAALVVTRAPEGLTALFLQRQRWASKGLHYPEIRITLLALLVYSFNVTILLSLITAPWNAFAWPSLAIGFALKLAAEWWMFSQVCRHFNRMGLLPLMLAGQVFEIPYVAIAGAAGAAGRYEWKGRQIRR